MATPKRITDEQHALILELHDGKRSIRSIAKEAGCSPATVSRIVKEAGLEFVDKRTQVATAVRVARIRADRLDLAEQLMEDAFKLRKRMWEPHKYYERGAEGMILVTLPLPSIRDQRDGYATIESAVSTHDRLMSNADDSTTQDDKSVLEKLMDGLKSRVAADRATGDTPPGEGTMA